MKGNEAVVRAWYEGKPAKANRLWTDGVKIYSYDLLIGFTGEDGLKYVKNYTARTDVDCFGNKVPAKFISMTTSKHVSLARRLAYSVPPD